MAQCILCSAQLPAETKPEHVWLASLGGRKTTRQALCSACNNAMGSGPDKELAESVAFLRNLLNLESGRGAPPPTIKGLSHGDDRVALKPGGIPVVDGGRPFVITPMPDGNPRVELRVSSAEQLRRILPDLARALNMPLADVKASMRSADVRHVSQRIGTQHHQVSLGGPEAMRSMLKTCLTLWADLHGNAEIQRSIYDDARRFVRFGDDHLATSICKIDMGPLSGSEALEARFGPHFNLVLVASDSAGRVVGYFRLYNTCAWRFELCAGGAPSSSIITYISNPEQPAVWDICTTDAVISAAAILDTEPSHDFTTARSAFWRMYTSYHDEASRNEISKICDEVARKHALGSDEPMTPEQIDRYIYEVSHRMASWMVGVPFEQSLSPEEIARLIDDEENA